MSEEYKNKIRSIGPALPPGFNRNEYNDSPDTSIKEDEIPKAKRVIGPSRPPIDTSARSRSRSPPPETTRPKLIVRESWMTEAAIPSPTARIDPLNIKPRTFIQRQSASFTSDINLDELDPSIKAKDKEIDEQIKKYNEVHRQKTLQEIHEDEHMGKKKAQSAQDMEERIFDWERDMNSSVHRMTSKSAKDLVSKSNLSDRFGTSSSKKYL